VLYGRGEGLLNRLLGEVDVAEETGEDRDRAPVLGAEDLGEV
jgi:hypothetical protein